MDVRVSWTPSISNDVVVQKLSWLVNDEVVREVDLVPTASERLASHDGVSFVEGDIVGVSIVVSDGKSLSTAVVGEVQVPLDPPQPVTNLVIKLVEAVNNAVA
jgi:hypothetical protein